MKRERERARELRATSWWREKISAGTCHHCGKKFRAKDLTMDHLIPLARGGESVKSNVVTSCLPCNQEKGLESPLDEIFRKLEEERKERGSDVGE
jgi:5-methylcytosine-specific restriction endonuclease McrA